MNVVPKKQVVYKDKLIRSEEEVGYKAPYLRRKPIPAMHKYWKPVKAF